MTTVAIHQPQYLSYLGYFQKIRDCDRYVVLDTATFQPRSVQNRNQIKTKAGLTWLTLPVTGKQTTVIKDVTVAPHLRAKWRKQHWRTIQMNYAKAPFFETLGPGLEAALMGADHTHLVDVNMALTDWALGVLGIQTSTLRASDLAAGGTSTERLVNICKELGATRYLSGSGGKNYMELDLFESAGIEVIWQQFEAPHYEQLHAESGFAANLSVVDALLCAGPAIAQAF